MAAEPVGHLSNIEKAKEAAKTLGDATAAHHATRAKMLEAARAEEEREKKKRQSRIARMHQTGGTKEDTTVSDALKAKEEKIAEADTLETIGNHLAKDEFAQQVLIDQPHLHAVQKAQEAKNLANKMQKEMESFEAEREQLAEEAARKASAQQEAAKKRAAAAAAERESKRPRLIAVTKKVGSSSAVEPAPSNSPDKSEAPEKKSEASAPAGIGLGGYDSDDSGSEES